ncbi:hypothetical protein P7K49_013546, partial [Saguinus oedipus]
HLLHFGSNVEHVDEDSGEAVEISDHFNSSINISATVSKERNQMNLEKNFRLLIFGLAEGWRWIPAQL